MYEASVRLEFRRRGGYRWCREAEASGPKLALSSDLADAKVPVAQLPV